MGVCRGWGPDNHKERAELDHLKHSGKEKEDAAVARVRSRLLEEIRQEDVLKELVAPWKLKSCWWDKRLQCVHMKNMTVQVRTLLCWKDKEITVTVCGRVVHVQANPCCFAGRGYVCACQSGSCKWRSAQLHFLSQRVECHESPLLSPHWVTEKKNLTVSLARGANLAYRRDAEHPWASRSFGLGLRWLAKDSSTHCSDESMWMSDETMCRVSTDGRSRESPQLTSTPSARHRQGTAGALARHTFSGTLIIRKSELVVGCVPRREEATGQTWVRQTYAGSCWTGRFFHQGLSFWVRSSRHWSSAMAELHRTDGQRLLPEKAEGGRAAEVAPCSASEWEPGCTNDPKHLVR